VQKAKWQKSGKMTSLSQSPRDRILWILSNNGSKMERSRLRAATGMRYALLNPILDELVKEGRIKNNSWEGWRHSILNKPIGRKILFSYVTLL
jgi:predicted transcriptional regulator